MGTVVTPSRAETFSSRVAALFATQVFGAGVGIVNGIILARLLGPEGKGDYYLLMLVPTTAMVFVQFGLPQALGFYAARGHTLRIVSRALVLVGTLSLGALLAVVVLLPVLREIFLEGLPPEQVLFAFTALPLSLLATFTSGIVMGRQAVRWYSAVNVVHPVLTTLLLVVVLGGLGASVMAAIAVHLVGLAFQAFGYLVGAGRASRAVPEPRPVTFRELFRYGLPLYPTGLTAFFNYRADAYIIAWLILDSSAAIGFYSMAVGLAELTFFFPNAVSSLFFPHVAGSSREDSDRQVAMVSRVTLLVTGAVAVLLVPAAFVMIHVLLPAFVPSIPPLLLLLPGVVALSPAKVLAGYISGIGRPGVNSVVSIVTFSINIAANLVLIPRFGILGAAAASLFSYTASGVIMAAVVARATNVPVLEFWVPRRADVRFTIASLAGVIGRLRLAGAGLGRRHVG
jgi:O-antigen/teichoic acid export membrane protein